MIKWETPNRCDNSGPNCVEVGTDCATGERYVRDNKDRQGPFLTFTAEEWEAFTASVRAGQF